MMTQIVFDNKKIAKFMGYTYFPHNMEGVKDPGWKTHIDATRFTKHNHTHNFFSHIISNKGEPVLKIQRGVEWKYLCRSHNQLSYHNSWEWLMPVVMKISEIDNQSDIEMYNTEICGEKYIDLEIRSTSILCDQSEVYRRVVEYVEWYEKYLAI